jgi:hypothetical protein
MQEFGPTEARQPTRNMADMRILLNSLYPAPEVSIHLTTARWVALHPKCAAIWCTQRLTFNLVGSGRPGYAMIKLAEGQTPMCRELRPINPRASPKP